MNLTSCGSKVALVLLLAGCGAAPVREQAVVPEVVTKTRVVDTACQWVVPIHPAKTDILADSTARQINAYYEAGVKHCGWPALK